MGKMIDKKHETAKKLEEIRDYADVSDWQLVF